MKEEMRKDLFELYQQACKCYYSADASNDKKVIELGASLYVKYYTELPPLVADTLSLCIPYTNVDVEEGTTLEQYISQGVDILSEITGILGEIFAD